MGDRALYTLSLTDENGELVGIKKYRIGDERNARGEKYDLGLRAQELYVDAMFRLGRLTMDNWREHLGVKKSA
jgi:hypothetical protein